MAKIVIAEDEPHMLRLLEMTLRKGGHAWTACINGSQAVAAATQQLPDIVILDVIMPEMDGLAALKVLKSNPATAGIPVLMLTARGHSLTRQEAEESGAAAFLTKPFSPTEVLSIIEKLLN
jgi:CheY-like chemotaxis protein